MEESSFGLMAEGIDFGEVFSLAADERYCWLASPLIGVCCCNTCIGGVVARVVPDDLRDKALSLSLGSTTPLYRLRQCDAR
jgi:hypothetical protein